jgi:hypothetical protein
MPTRRFSGITVAASEPDNGGDNSGGGGSGGGYVDDVFSTYVYEGTGAGQTIENGIDLDGEGGLVWIKRRDAAYGHVLIDTERGGNSSLDSSNNGPPQIDYAPITFNSDGFTCTVNKPAYNSVQSPYVSWAFRKARKFFDVITYKADNNGLTLSHNLGVEPGIIIIKNASIGGRDWYVYHKSLGHTKSLALNNTAKEGGSSEMVSPPTDKTFTLSGVNGTTCVEPYEYVAYVFAHDDSDESMVKCGSYIGNGSNDGPTIDLGFEPQWLLVKNASQPSSWFITDSMRGMGGRDTNKPYLSAESSNYELDLDVFYVTSDGFKISSSSASYNQSGDTFIYMAIRRPNKPAEEFEPEELFAVDTMNVDGQFESGFPVDFAIQRNSLSGIDDNNVMGRLMGERKLTTNSTAGEVSEPKAQFDYPDRWYEGAGQNADNVSWMWRRAPGFFDVVTWTGGGSGGELRERPHSLGVVPEMMIFKSRPEQRGAGWSVYHKDLGADRRVRLNAYQPVENTSDWNNTAPTSTGFTVGGPGYEWDSLSQNYIAYFFASVPGISKVGSYTGTGNDLNIHCGFSAGARFVLIKRTDVSGDWYVWDAKRGIVAGNDPYLLLNDTAAQVTNTDYIDPLASGFTVTSSAPDAINANTGKYIYYAIA